MPAHGNTGHSSLGVWGSYQVSFALQEVFVLWVVSQPAKQGLAGVMTHSSVGQAHCQRHEGQEIVGVELQTPGWRRNAGIEKGELV